MNNIICPNCGEKFHLSESAYADIATQVRNEQFEAEVQNRIGEIKSQFKAEEEAEKLKVQQKHSTELSDKDKQINDLKSKVSELNVMIKGFETTKESELAALEAKKDKERIEAVKEKEDSIKELEKILSDTEHQEKINVMKARNEGKEELQTKEQEIIKLKSEIENAKLLADNKLAQIKEQHKLEIDIKQNEIERLRDFKLKLSTKMVGETLEQHCSIQFAQCQSMGMFPNATFEKDTKSVEGTKGDFILRDYIDGDPYISVMFEMKNEMDATATKHRNEDFLDKLDKDRTKKNCEYAVLVSMLEQDNPLYDNGIVDMSHKYPKMLVIRPQFFMPVLRILTAGARKGFEEKRQLVTELARLRNESLDLSKFQDKINKVVERLNKNYDVAHEKFETANKNIDKVIETLKKQVSMLESIKASFGDSDKKLLQAREIGKEDLTIKKLTHGIPNVKKMIEEADK